jgi:hypothetical protein
LNKSPFFYKKTLVMVSIAISVLIILASLPSVFASKTIYTSNIIKELRENFVKNIKDKNDGSSLPWEPGIFLQIFLLTLELYVLFLKNNSWFPGLTFIMAYLFVVLCILSLIESPEDVQILDLKKEIASIAVTSIC